MHKKYSRAYARILKRRQYRKIIARVIIILIVAGMAAVAGVLVAYASEKEPAVKPQQAHIIPYRFQSMNAGVAAILDDFDTEYIAAPTTKKEVETTKTTTEKEVESTKETTKKANYNLKNDDTYLLAKLAMAEAEGEDTEGKALVIRTVLNRMKSEAFPDSVSEVIYQKDAFTPIRNGRFNRVEPDEDCWAAVELVIEQGWDNSRGALYFERNTTESTWHNRNLKKLFVHGNHTFYKEVES